MRNVFIAVGFALCMSQAASWATGPYTLENRFHDGETVFLDFITQNQGMSQVREMQEPQPLEMTIHAVTSFYTRLVNPDGSANVDVELELINMISPVLGIREPMDLREAVMHPDELRFEMAILPSGEVQENPVTASVGQPLPGMDDLNNTPMELRPYPLLPKTPVRVGDRWTESWVIPFASASEAVISYATYTLQRVDDTEDGRIAHIRTETSVHFRDVAFDPLSPREDIEEYMRIGQRFREYRAEGTGVLTFHIDQGRAIHYEDDKRIHADLDIIILADGEPSVSDVKQIYRMRTRARYTTEPPTAPGLDLDDPWR